jgi:8-oxo-dGTP pyrophosphatase MutT (NUDIX family)
MKNVTLCFVLDGQSHVLLGMKKRGFGVDKWNGFGGKIHADETPRQAAVRELQEECGVRARPDDLESVGSLTFRFPYRPAFDHYVHVFLARRWEGTPVETAEMRPVWYPIEALPLGAMWDDDRYWLPLVLAGVRLEADFTYKADNESVDTATIRPLHRI